MALLNTPDPTADEPAGKARIGRRLRRRVIVALTVVALAAGGLVAANVASASHTCYINGNGELHDPACLPSDQKWTVASAGWRSSSGDKWYRIYLRAGRYNGKIYGWASWRGNCCKTIWVNNLRKDRSLGLQVTNGTRSWMADEVGLTDRTYTNGIPTRSSSSYRFRAVLRVPTYNNYDGWGEKTVRYTKWW